MPRSPAGTRTPICSTAPWSGARSTAPPRSIADAGRGRGLVFCAAPVGELPASPRRRCQRPERTPRSPTSARSSAGPSPRTARTRGSSAATRSPAPRPRASSNARADLFDGARWYLTPTPQTGGVVYDRVQRVVDRDRRAAPGDRRAEAHDRLMATVSHLPHVLANVLVEQAADSLRAGDDERLPEIGPSFRDATRVAGANPAIWGDIFAGNREALAAEVESVADEAERRGELIREADAATGSRPGSARRATPAGSCSGRSWPAARSIELRLIVPNKPGIVAELALALGRGGVNIEDMALHPAADMKTGAVSLFVAGEDEAGRAAELVRELGHDVTRRDRAVSVRFDPAGALSGGLRPPPDKSISHRAALIGAMSDGPTRITGYLDSADTRSTLEAVRAVGATVTEGDPDDDGGLFVEVVGAGLRGARSAQIDVGNSGTLLRILPGWLAGQPEGSWTLAGDESIARRPVGRVAEPLAAMGAAVSSARWAAAARGRRLAAARRRARSPDRQRPGQVLPAPRRAVGGGGDHGARAGRLARPHRADARRRGGDPAPQRHRGRRRARRAPRVGGRHGPGRLLVGGLLRGRRPDRPGQRDRAARGGDQPPPHRHALDPLEDGRGDGRRSRARPRDDRPRDPRARPGARCDAPRAPLRAAGGRGRGRGRPGRDRRADPDRAPRLLRGR